MKKILSILFFLIPLLSYSQEVLYHLNYSINEHNLSKLGEVKENVEITIYSDRTLRVKKNGELFVNDSHIIYYCYEINEQRLPSIIIIAYDKAYTCPYEDDTLEKDDYFDEDDEDVDGDDFDRTIILEISPYNDIEAGLRFHTLGHLSLKTMKLTTFRKQNLDTFDSMRNAIKKKNLFSMNNSNNIAPSKSIIKADFHGTRVGTIAHIPANGVDKNDLFFQCNVSVYGAKGKNVTLIAYVDGPQQGVGLKNPNGHYTTPDGTVAISKTVQALENNEGTQWKQFLLILPFSELGLRNGDHVINVRWFASVDGMFIGNSGFQTIRFTKRNSDITNFRVDGGEATPGYF